MDSMPRQKGASKFGIMSIAIDANSRAPLHIPIPGSCGTRSDITDGDDTRSCGALSEASTMTTICSEAEYQVPLVDCSSGSTKPLSNADHERKIWNRSQRSKIQKLSSDLNSRMSRIRQHILTETQEAREMYLLLTSCRKSSLARKVRKGSEGRLRATQPSSRKPSPASQPSSLPTQDPAPETTQGSSSEPTPLNSRKASNSLLSLFSDTSRKSSTTTLASISAALSSSSTATATSLPPRRKISAPLEHNPAFHPRQFSQQLEIQRSRTGSSISSTVPVFRMPVYTPPSADDCTACEIVRIVPHDDIAEDEAVTASPRVKVLRRLSDEKGNCFIEEVPDAGGNGGRKKVLLQWGREVDVIIPPAEMVEEDEDEEESGPGKGFRERVREGGKVVVKRWRGVKERVRRGKEPRDQLAEDADLLWEMYP